MRDILITLGILFSWFVVVKYLIIIENIYIFLILDIIITSWLLWLTLKYAYSKTTEKNYCKVIISIIFLGNLGLSFSALLFNGMNIIFVFLFTGVSFFILNKNFSLL